MTTDHAEDPRIFETYKKQGHYNCQCDGEYHYYVQIHNGDIVSREDCDGSCRPEPGEADYERFIENQVDAEILRRE